MKVIDLLNIIEDETQLRIDLKSIDSTMNGSFTINRHNKNFYKDDHILDRNIIGLRSLEEDLLYIRLE